MVNAIIQLLGSFTIQTLFHLFADLNWQFHVIASDEKNAFVLPGGKVFVFTGILPVTQNEDGLAAVLGHEVRC